MATKKSEEETYETEQTEPEPFLGTEESSDNSQVADAGVPGQIAYPDREVDAERAAAFAAGKVDTLDPDEEERTDRERIQDDLDNYHDRDEKDEESDKDV